MKRTWPYVFILLATFGCKSDDRDSIFKLLSEKDTGIDFVNTIQETEQDNVLNYEYFYNGGGVAAILITTGLLICTSRPIRGRISCI